MQHQSVHITLALAGYRKTGKTTLAGHLLWHYGDFDKKTLEIIEKEVENMGRPASKYNLILNHRRFNRMYNSLLLRKMQTDKLIFTVIDASGHRQIIRGISQADVVLLTISAISGEFEAGMSSQGQTREHILMAYTLSEKTIIVCINKMDDSKVVWSQTRFEEIKKEVCICLKKVGFNPENIPFIPISSELGDNILTKSDNLSWYNGPTLLDALNNIPLPKRSMDKPLRIPILYTSKIKGVGTVCVGKIAAGALKSDEYICLGPLETRTPAHSIEMYNKALKQASAGDCVGISLRHMPAKDVRKGFMIGDFHSPSLKVSSFCARVIIISHPGQIKVGYSPVVYVHTARVPCKFAEIKAIVNKETEKVIESEPKMLKNGDHALVTLIPLNPLCVETYKDYPSLGKFVISDNGHIVAAGRIESVEKASEIKVIYS